MPPDLLGIDKQQEQQPSTTLDYLGNRSPVAFSSQPSLPAAGPGAGAGGGPSTAPATIGGAGVAPSAAPESPFMPSGETSFADLSNAVGLGGAGGEGPGASGVGQGSFPSFSTSSGPFGISGSPFGVSFEAGPFGIGLGPAGNVGAGINTGNPVLNSAVSKAAQVAGVPMGQNLPGLVASLLGSKALSAFAGAFGMAGIPFTFVNLVHQLASLSPTSTTSLQEALANPNPEAPITPEQALAIVQGKQMGPSKGGLSEIGALPMDNPLMGPQGAAFGLGGQNPNAPGPQYTGQIEGFLGLGPRGAGVDPSTPAAQPEGTEGAEGAAAADSGEGGPW